MQQWRKVSLLLAPIILLEALVILVGCQHAPTKKDLLTVPRFKKVVLVIFENEDIDKPLSQPFFSRLAKEGALLTNYHAVAHPSEPNYIALTSGDTHGVIDDANYDLNVRHLGDLLDEKGLSWRNYAEDFPGQCYQGAVKGRYVRKHTPFMSYVDVSQSAGCKNIIDASHFAADVKSGNIPNFSFYTPNMDNDGHDTDIVYGEKWFRKNFEPLLSEPAFKDVLLVVTFDENECNTVGPYVTKEKLAICKGDTNKVYTVFYGRDVKAGITSDTEYTHYSLLKTIEAGFDLKTLGRQDDKAQVISEVWK